MNANQEIKYGTPRSWIAPDPNGDLSIYTARECQIGSTGPCGVSVHKRRINDGLPGQYTHAVSLKEAFESMQFAYFLDNAKSTFPQDEQTDEEDETSYRTGALGFRYSR